MIGVRIATNRLAKKLKDEQFRVLMYYSRTADTAYIKLDYGVSGTVRIAQYHAPRDNFQCRYNLIQQIPGVRVDTKGAKYTRYFYGFEMLDKLVSDAVAYRLERGAQIGKERYIQYMKDGWKKSQEGFWSMAIEI